MFIEHELFLSPRARVLLRGGRPRQDRMRGAPGQGAGVPKRQEVRSRVRRERGVQHSAVLSLARDQLLYVLDTGRQANKRTFVAYQDVRVCYSLG